MAGRTELAIPSKPGELPSLGVNGNDEGSSREAPIDFDGAGVSEQEIDRWIETNKRFKDNKFLREDNWELYWGEDFYRDILDGKHNDVNNPLRLHRPYKLQNFQEFTGNQGNSRYDDSKDRNNYPQALQRFEQLAKIGLQSLNITDTVERRTFFKEALDKVFAVDKQRLYGDFDLQKVVPGASKEDWLIHTVLSLLNNPSPEITPIGRIRSLELLGIYQTDRLAAAFAPKGANLHNNGFSFSHIPHIPHTKSSKAERETFNISQLRIADPRLRDSIAITPNGSIDWQLTTVNLTQETPHEAIQIVLIILNNHTSMIMQGQEYWERIPGALEFLSQVPSLDKATLTKMFGRKATFLAEHKLQTGIGETIAEGIGTSSSPDNDIESIIENATPDDVKKIVRRQALQIAELKNLLAEKETSEAARFWVKEENIDVLDPKGYYRILGLHPVNFEGLTEEDVTELVKRHYIFYSLRYHPDLPTGDTGKMRHLIEAFNFFSEPENRKRYSQ